MIDLNLMLNPPKQKGRTLKEIVSYINRVYVQRELTESLDVVTGLLPEIPNEPELRRCHDTVIHALRAIARVNSHLLKEQLEELLRYDYELRMGNTQNTLRFLKGLEERLLKISQEDFFYLGRKPRYLRMSNMVVDAPRIRPERGIKDADYRLQRFSIDLTTRCNYRCLKCFRSETIDDKNVDIDFNLLKRLIDEALEMGVQDFGLMGGEPTLYCRFDDLLRYFQEKARTHKGPPFYVILFTNGSGLCTTDERRRLVRESPFLDVWFTIETFDRELYPIVHGCADHCFDEVIRNLGYAIEDGLPQEQRLCVTYPQSRNNIYFSEEVWRFCRATGIFPRFTFVTKVGRAKELLANRALSDEERAKVTETIVAVDSSLGYKTTYSYNGIGINPFRAYNFLAVNAEGKTWDFYVNIPGLDMSEHTLQEVWSMNLKRLNDPDFLRAQSDSPYKITREFVQRRLEELKDGKKI